MFNLSDTTKFATVVYDDAKVHNILPLSKIIQVDHKRKRDMKLNTEGI